MEVWVKLFGECEITEFEVEVIFKIVLASFCGGLLGLEREIKGRPAGIKTFSLVCIGAALIMVTNHYISSFLSHNNGDLARMPAQVISGIGFLGAGSIMVTGHNQIKGLTTAAALWVTAALGIAIGCGFYFGALIGVFVVYVTSFLYRYCDRKLMEKSRNMTICVEGENEEFLFHLLNYFKDQNIRVKSMQRKEENKWYVKDVCVTVEIQFSKRTLHTTAIEGIKKIEGLQYIEEM